MIIFSIFWIALFLLVFIFAITCYKKCGDFELLGGGIILIPILFIMAHLLTWIIVDKIYPEPIKQYIDSVEELPIQTLEYPDGKKIKVVLASSVDDLDVRKVKNIVAGDITKDTKIYKIMEKDRFYCYVLLFPGRKIVTDKRPVL